MPSSLNGTGVTFNDATTLQSGNIPAANLGSGTADSSTFLRGDKTWAAAGGGGGRGQVLTSSGTFTVPAGVTAVKVTVIGGGGGSGGALWNSYWGSSQSSGAGGGGTAIKYITGLTPGSTVSVTVGAGGSAGGASSNGGSGGTSSFGAYCSATGGGGTAYGFYNNGTYSNNARGTPGTASGGDINATASQIGDRMIGGAALVLSAGGGPLATTCGNPGPASSGRGFGAGASGAGYNSTNCTQSSQNGAAGTSGAVIVEW